MANTEKSAVKVIFGAMTFGRDGTEQARIHTLSDCSVTLDIFQTHDHNEIDTARFYGEGSSEEFLGDLEWQEMSKSNAPEEGWRHTLEHLRENLMDSLKALKTNKVDVRYLHGPDRTTPYKISEICKTNGYVMPSIYQGVYNALHRSVELELFPCLKYYGMGFYNYNPSTGGYLTSRYHRDTKENSLEAGLRFDPSRCQGKMYRQRYWNDAYFDALDILRPTAERHGLTEAECALRWMTHHTQLKREFGDGIIIGVSITKHMEENMKLLDDPNRLSEEVVQALDAGWEKVKGISGQYWH